MLLKGGLARAKHTDHLQIMGPNLDRNLRLVGNISLQININILWKWQPLREER